MPYASNEDLPHPVRAHLRPEALDIFRSAFNPAGRPTARASLNGETRSPTASPGR